MGICGSSASASDLKHVVVIGGGLAGMAAAVALHSAGLSVRLVEARRSLGGRAGSFQDPQTGETLDNCQHVLLGCCTNLNDFYRRIGAANLIRHERTIHFVDASGKFYDLGGTPGLPAPLHLSAALARFNLLSLGERAALAKAMTAILRLGGRLDHLIDVPFGDWLDRHRQPESLVRKLYDPIVVSGLNEQTRPSSAAYAIKIFQDSLLRNSAGYVMGMPACPLSELYGSLPVDDVRLGTRVGGLRFEGNRVIGVDLQDGTSLPADAVVLATNFHAIHKWVPAELLGRDARFASLEKLESVPILGAHLWFDRPVLTRSHAALVEPPLQWVFRKDAAGAALHGVISAAREWLDVPKDQALRRFEEQIRHTFPAAREAKLLRGSIVIEKRATFSPVPGHELLRPTQSPPADGIGGLYLAGDYTRTGWPSTMEGAVRSGYLAAEGVTGKKFLVDDLAPQWPAKLAARL